MVTVRIAKGNGSRGLHSFGFLEYGVAVLLDAKRGCLAREACIPSLVPLEFVL